MCYCLNTSAYYLYTQRGWHTSEFRITDLGPGYYSQSALVLPFLPRLRCCLCLNCLYPDALRAPSTISRTTSACSRVFIFHLPPHHVAIDTAPYMSQTPAPLHRLLLCRRRLELPPLGTTTVKWPDPYFFLCVPVYWERVWERIVVLVMEI